MKPKTRFPSFVPAPEPSGCNSGLEAISLIEKMHQTRCGAIHYYTDILNPEELTLVFLPGLSADHRLFDKQVEYFEGKYNIFVWDAPAHAASRPFSFDFDLFDKAKWLEEILIKEKIEKPIIVGQSMGGYLAQAYSELYPDRLKGFVSVDSGPLKRKYVTGAELWMLKRMEPLYYVYPWKLILKFGTSGVATTEYGRALMRKMWMVYDGNKRYYAKLVGHGYRILAEAMEKELPYEIKCPALLICGQKDHAGSCIRYSKAWHRNTGIPLQWIEGAAHNSNTDRPDVVNALIKEFADGLEI